MSAEFETQQGYHPEIPQDVRMVSVRLGGRRVISGDCAKLVSDLIGYSKEDPAQLTELISEDYTGDDYQRFVGILGRTRDSIRIAGYDIHNAVKRSEAQRHKLKPAYYLTASDNAVSLEVKVDTWQQNSGQVQEGEWNEVVVDEKAPIRELAKKPVDSLGIVSRLQARRKMKSNGLSNTPDPETVIPQSTEVSLIPNGGEARIRADESTVLVEDVLMVDSLLRQNARLLQRSGVDLPERLPRSLREEYPIYEETHLDIQRFLGLVRMLKVLIANKHDAYIEQNPEIRSVFGTLGQLMESRDVLNQLLQSAKVKADLARGLQE